MKILHIMPYSPVPTNFGGALRTFNIMKAVVPHHEVTVAMFGAPSDEALLQREFGGRLRGVTAVAPPWQRKHYRLGQAYSTLHRHSFFHMLAVSGAMQRTIDRLLDAVPFDIVQTEFSHLGSYRLDTGAVKIMDCHNVEYDNFRRMWLNDRRWMRKAHYYLEYRKLRREEIEGCRRQDALFTTSERDRAIFERDVPGVPSFVVPNGVDAGYFTPGDEPAGRPTLVFTGMMAYVPNYDGILYFLDEILPIVRRSVPDIMVYVVGNRPPAQLTARASESVVVTGFVEDVRPYIRKADIYIVPLRMGGGTRLKITEALSMKKPIVTTSIGCEGIDVVSGESALIADRPAEFAESVVRLLRDRDLRKRLVTNGHALVRDRYEWGIIGRNILDLYQRMTERRPSGT